MQGSGNRAGPITSYEAGDAPRAVFTIAVVLVLAAAIGISYRSVRGYRRWRRENHPLAGTFTRYDRMGTGLRSRRADLSDVARFVAEVLSAVQQSRPSLI